MDLGRKWLVDFIEQSNKTGAIDGEMNESVLMEKLNFKMLGLFFSSKLD